VGFSFSWQAGTAADGSDRGAGGADSRCFCVRGAQASSGKYRHFLTVLTRSYLPGYPRPGSAPDDLRDTLVAQLHHLRDRRHRKASPVGDPDRLVALGAKPLAGALQVGLVLGVVPGKGDELGASIRRLTFRTGDQPIVRSISAIRLAQTATMGSPRTSNLLAFLVILRFPRRW
jgi:hypothetical protein